MNLPALDSLRGLLALYVIAGHARWLLWAGHHEWLHSSPSKWELWLGYSSALLRFGHEAVMVFFILSGFFIHLRAAKKIAVGLSVSFSPQSFYQRRWQRLGVPFFAALSLTVVLDLVGQTWNPRLYNGETGDSLLDSIFARKGYSVESVVPALFLLPSSLGKDFGTNGPLWSLAYEVVYYLAYPVWLAVRRFNGPLAAALGLLAAALGGAGWLPGFLAAVAIHYPLWLAGAFLAEFANQSQSVYKLRPWHLLAAPVLLLPGILDMPWLAVVPLYLFGGACIVCGFAGLPIEFNRTHVGRITQFVGLRSYTIYICHFPMLAFLGAWVIQVEGRRPLSGWLAASGAAITLVICAVISGWVERRYLYVRLKFGHSA